MTIPNEAEALEGILLMDKPAGPTSHDVVAHVRRALDIERVGHAGTLDPIATGLLVLCLGRATRLARFIGAGPKLYEGSIRLGFFTDTDDVTGQTLAAPSPGFEPPPLERVRWAAASLVGERMQVPPAYSAKKVAGVPAHRRARRGQRVSLAPVPVTIYSFNVLGASGQSARFTTLVSAGTYVRALARELGEALGTGACLESLRRRASGGFRVEEAIPLHVSVQGMLEHVLPLNQVPLDFPTLALSSEQASRVLEGQALAGALAVDGRPEKVFRLVDPEGRLVAIGRFFRDWSGREGIRPEVVFPVLPVP